MKIKMASLSLTTFSSAQFKLKYINHIVLMIKILLINLIFIFLLFNHVDAKVENK